MITHDLSRRSIATSGESVSTYPHRPKAEAFSNVVDVVKRLHDQTDTSTKYTAPPCSAHVQHDDVPHMMIIHGLVDIDHVITYMIRGMSI